MVPRLMQYGKYTIFFRSREEPRVHVHVESPDGEAKFWLYPEVELVKSYGFSQKELSKLKTLLEENIDEFRRVWQIYFANRRY